MLHLDRDDVELIDLAAAHAHAQEDAPTALRNAAGEHWIAMQDSKGTKSPGHRKQPYR